MSYQLQKLFTLMLHHFQPINLIFLPILDFICSLPLLISRATSFLSCKALSLLQRVGDRRGGRIRHSLWFEHCCEKPESFEVYFIKIIKRKDLVGVMSYLSTYSLDLKRKATADTSGLGEVFVLNISTRHVTLRRTTRPTDFELQFLFPWGTALFHLTQSQQSLSIPLVLTVKISVLNDLVSIYLISGSLIGSSKGMQSLMRSLWKELVI